MEFVDGRSLQAVMKRNGQLPLSAAMRIARDVAEILAAAHKAGIVHRDLKPDNILLSRDEKGTDFTKILDFGVAKFVDEQNMTGKTKIGSIIGTPWYMPPEQCQGFLTVDARSDIYALGCVFFQMVCGKVPFAGSLRDVLMAQVHVAPPPPHNFCPDIPPEVEGLILRMMAKEAEDRPSSMDEVAATLSEFANPAPSRDKADRRTDKLHSSQRKNRWAAPFLAAIVAGLGTAAVFYFLGL
jgi:serine/threonine-protein kinase